LDTPSYNIFHTKFTYVFNLSVQITQAVVQQLPSLHIYSRPVEGKKGQRGYKSDNINVNMTFRCMSLYTHSITNAKKWTQFQSLSKCRTKAVQPTAPNAADDIFYTCAL